MMAKNRKIPFGYRMEFGTYIPQPAEAETVRRIYQTYLAGASYKALVEALQERGVVYDECKLWNKNMVARILEDARYVGMDRYPAILPEEQFHSVQERRRDRRSPACLGGAADLGASKSTYSEPGKHRLRPDRS